VDYVVKGSRKKASIGNFDSKGGNSQTIESLLDDGVLSPAQARLVASEWKNAQAGNRHSCGKNQENGCGRGPSPILSVSEADRLTCQVRETEPLFQYRRSNTAIRSERHYREAV
jgi:hypothetical protein